MPGGMQNYFAGLLVEQVEQQTRGQSLKQALQAVLANLQSLYQHNQLIFQVKLCCCTHGCIVCSKYR